MSYTMAMLAFWVLEVSTFIFILFAFEYLASGHLFPLDILPRGLEQALFFTPFPYQLYFPVSIYMGKATGVDMVRGLLIQSLWVIAAYGMARFAWRRGSSITRQLADDEFMNSEVTSLHTGEPVAQ